MTTLTADNFIKCDNRQLLAQIGTMNVLATSGGRVEARETGVTLPVRYGYAVSIDLHANDTYTVRRLHRRGGKVSIKGEATHVYAEQLSEVVYRAGCYHDEF
jgi:hypothetical protein